VVTRRLARHRRHRRVGLPEIGIDVSIGSIIDMDATFVSTSDGIVLVHQGNVVGRDDDRVPDLLSSMNRRSSAAPDSDRRYGRLIGEQKLRPRNDARAIAARCFSPPERTAAAPHTSPSPTFQEFDTSWR